MKKIVCTVLLCLFAGTAVAATVKIGAVQPLSGKISVYGEGFQRAINLAVEEVNAAGGIKGQDLEIVYEDNLSTAQGSVSALQKLISIEKLPVVIGPAASSNFLATCPIAEREKTVFIGAESAASDISSCGSYVFRVFPSDMLQGVGVAKLAEELDYKEVALTYINNDWGVGLANAFKEKYKGKIVEEFTYDEGKADYRSEVLRLKKSNPAAVVNLTYIKEGGTMLKQAHEMKFNPQWLLGSAAKSPKLVELAGEAAEGLIGTYPTFSKTSGLYEHYKAAFAKKYPDEKLPIFGEYNYDMIHLLAKALNNADDLTADSIQASLISASQGFEGVTGDLSFDENGDVGASYGRWSVKDGKIIEN
jgi:ABC-type branched-subunit amino acid transport system substrate-binding protein